MSLARGCFCSLVTVAGGTPQMTAVRRIFAKKSSVSWASTQSSTCFSQSCNSDFLRSFKVKELIHAFSSLSWHLAGKWEASQGDPS